MSARVVLVYPELLGTYGDRGNALVLVDALRRAGHAARIEAVAVGEPVPADGTIYLIGGGEDGPQRLAADMLARDRGLARAAEAGRPILAVCAGLQLLGRSFTAEGRTVEGLGLLPVVSEPGTARAVGEVVLAPFVPIGQGLVTGFENHGGITRIEGGAMPFGRVLAGVGNGVGGVDGVVSGSILGTYLHGPVLARNPGVVAWLLRRAGIEPVPPSALARALTEERTRSLAARARLPKWQRSPRIG